MSRSSGGSLTSSKERRYMYKRRDAVNSNYLLFNERFFHVGRPRLPSADLGDVLTGAAPSSPASSLFDKDPSSAVEMAPVVVDDKM